MNETMIETIRVKHGLKSTKKISSFFNEYRLPIFPGGLVAQSHADLYDMHVECKELKSSSSENTTLKVNVSDFIKTGKKTLACLEKLITDINLPEKKVPEVRQSTDDAEMTGEEPSPFDLESEESEKKPIATAIQGGAMVASSKLPMEELQDRTFQEPTTFLD